MILPYQIQSFNDSDFIERWKNQFVSADRTFFEGLWRRTQEKETSEKSGWKSEADARVKILYFIDEYDVTLIENNKTGFYLKAPYLWLFLAIPVDEVITLRTNCYKALSMNWEYERTKKYHKRGDLTFQLYISENPPEKLAARHFPHNYQFVEATLTSSKTKIPEYKYSNPWSVFKSGIRKPLPRGNPSIIESVDEISKYLPFQVELGCGPSIEAGIPPLHVLHSLYDITDSGGNFIFCDDRFSLLSRLLENPEQFYCQSSFSYRTSLAAEPTTFYKLLWKLKNLGHLVGPVITNNFDGLARRVGLAEAFVRRYEEQSIVPDIDFDENAKSLLVVGSHADRRRIQEKARLKGLKIIYVDPEGYISNGKFYQYPVESPQNDDFLLRMTAQEFAEAYNHYLVHVGNGALP